MCLEYAQKEKGFIQFYRLKIGFSSFLTVGLIEEFLMKSTNIIWIFAQKTQKKFNIFFQIHFF